MRENVAVSVEQVSKQFRLYHDRPTTIKERMINFRRANYETFWALNDASLEIERGETAGLIGPNGSGKSTLLKMIAGIMRPGAGKIKTRGRVASLLELGAGFHPDLTGRENVYMNASIMGLSKRQTDRYFDDIVAFSELEQFIGQQVRHYSSGMYIRLGFAVAVHVDPDILLVDEVLSVGDEAFQRKCMNRINEFQAEGRTIVFVTHAVDLVRTLCNKAFFLHKGELLSQGQPATVIRAFREVIHGEAQGRGQEEKATKQIEIRSIEFLDAEESPRQRFETGQPMEIKISLEANEQIDDPVVGFALYDQNDVLLHGTNTLLRNVHLGRVKGNFEVRFRIARLPLKWGQVQVSCSVHNNDEDVVYDWIEKKAWFDIVNPLGELGYINFEVDAMGPPT